MMTLRSDPSTTIKGRMRIPGDKSISHRALIIGAIAVGETRIKGLLEAEDVLATAEALRTLGATIRLEDETWTVTGVGTGGFADPERVIDCGNSGTLARLLLGPLSVHANSAHVTGDSSLCSRPMNRVLVPLRKMGAVFHSSQGDRLPLLVQGARFPIPIEYEVPVPSAQVKSSILLAALNTPGKTTVIEQKETRDHTENLLQAFGARIETSPSGPRGKAISVEGYAELVATDVEVPGDPSSAAFPGLAALIVPGSEIVVENVGLNPLRTGFIETLKEMGADLEMARQHTVTGEPVADIAFRHGQLRATDIPPERAPSMIDEYPAIAVAAAFAKGRTRMRGLGELRVKESDRFAAIVTGLTTCGVHVEAEGDDILIDGCDGPPPGGGTIRSGLDHRIAMSFLVLGTGSREAVQIDDGSAIGTSFPEFVGMMNKLGGNISLA